MEKINSLLSVRERSVKETRERLEKAGFTQEETDDAIETAQRVGLLSNERFARAFIRGKSHTGWGRHKIIQRLRLAGIEDDIITSCSECFSSQQDEYDAALREVSKRRATSKNPYATYMRRLMGRGFSYDLSSSVVRDYLSGKE